MRVLFFIGLIFFSYYMCFVNMNFVLYMYLLFVRFCLRLLILNTLTIKLLAVFCTCIFEKHGSVAFARFNYLIQIN